LKTIINAMYSLKALPSRRNEMKKWLTLLLFIGVFGTGCTPVSLNTEIEPEQLTTSALCPSPTPTDSPALQSTPEVVNGATTSSINEPEVVTLVPVEGPTLTAEQVQAREDQLLGVNLPVIVEPGDGTPLGPGDDETNVLVTPTPCP
jgi:hypothetical protein